MSVANTILEQLGGRKFIVMTGAKLLTSYPDGLGFRLPGKNFCLQGINYVKITLNGLDLYEMKFYKLHGMNLKLLQEEHDIYADHLAQLFRKHTGLNTSL